MKHWIGISGFKHRTAKGGFSPDDFPIEKKLRRYAGEFRSVETALSLRRLRMGGIVEEWLRVVGRRFQFTFVAPPSLVGPAPWPPGAPALAKYHQAIQVFSEHAGPVLFELSPDLPKDPGLLEEFLYQVPTGMRVAILFGHKWWYREKVYALLRQHNAALCLVEGPGFATPLEVTADFGYFHLHIDRYLREELQQRAEFVMAQKERWTDAYIYFPNSDYEFLFSDARRFQHLLDA